VKLAFQYGKENVVIMPENWVKNECVTWLRGLKKCHESSCLGKPEAVSITQAIHFNCENVKACFENLRELMSRHSCASDKTCNLAETGNSTVGVPPKSICALGIEQVGSVTSGGRRDVIMTVAVYAVGKHVRSPLFTSFIFSSSFSSSYSLFSSFSATTLHEFWPAW
jgi:hypothetical protein